MSDEFINTQIYTENGNLENFQDDVQTENKKDENKKLKNMVGRKEIIQLKSNFIPRGLIPLEKLFDQNDVAKDPKVQPVDNAIED